MERDGQDGVYAQLADGACLFAGLKGGSCLPTVVTYLSVQAPRR